MAHRAVPHLRDTPPIIASRGTRARHGAPSAHPQAPAPAGPDPADPSTGCRRAPATAPRRAARRGWLAPALADCPAPRAPSPAPSRRTRASPGTTPVPRPAPPPLPPPPSAGRVAPSVPAGPLVDIAGSWVQGCSVLPHRCSDAAPICPRPHAPLLRAAGGARPDEARRDLLSPLDPARLHRVLL